MGRSAPAAFRQERFVYGIGLHNRITREVYAESAAFAKGVKIAIIKVKGIVFRLFKDLFIHKAFRSPNIVSGKNKNEIYVEGTAEYITPAGTKSKVIIACRPECRNKSKYIMQVSEFFAGKDRISDDELI